MKVVGNQKVASNKVKLTLFVGLGGIGSRIIQGVAKKCSKPERKRVNFVVLDTNANDLQDIKEDKDLKDVPLYYVQTSSASTVGEYLRLDKDAMDCWFPCNSVLYKKSMNDGAGQVRAISRLALNAAIKLNKLEPLTDAIDALYRKDGDDLEADLRVVMAFSANGGTGSGMALPLSMLISKYIEDEYPNTTVNIRGMAMLPSCQYAKITSKTEQMSLKRNAYATIKEINAFMMKSNGFIESVPELRRYSDLHIDIPIAGSDKLQRLDSKTFNFCFLLDGQDSEGKNSITQNQYEEQASMCLYEQNIGPMKKKSFSIEDNIVREATSKKNYGRNTFAGIGSSIIQYPFDLIAEYVSYQWAIDKMAGEDEADNWCKYDNDFQDLHKREVKEDIDTAEQTKLREYYVAQFEKDEGADPFAKNISKEFLKDADIKVENYVKELQSYLVDYYNSSSDSEYENIYNVTNSNQRFELDEESLGDKIDDLDLLNSYKNQVEYNAEKKMKQEVEGIFWNSHKNKKKYPKFFMESLLQKHSEFIHPNAMRYYIYKLRIELENYGENLNVISIGDDLYKDAENAVKDFEKGINTEDKKTRKKEDPVKLNKRKTEIIDSVNESLNGYFDSILSYLDKIALKVICDVGNEYLKRISEEFEEFYSSFKEKVEELSNKQVDIAESIKYENGSTVYNLCGSKEMLDIIAKESDRNTDEELVSPELCSKILDAIKGNIAVNRYNSYVDGHDIKRVANDIFDDIILKHFLDDVKHNCKKIDLNVLEAVEKESELEYIIERQEAGKKVLENEIHDRDRIDRHIEEIVDKGYLLAAPSVQKMRDKEPREINLVAYHESLDKMRAFNTKTIFAKFNETATDTVSKYEIRFLNAVYDITPDRIRKFSCSISDKIGVRSAGVYHRAYSEYSEDIGPDSEKTKVISTHIDKRWDSIRFMPEIDMDYQSYQIMRIHKAFVYSMLFDIVQYQPISHVKENNNIWNYFLENKDEHLEKMIVSNGTPCDQLYEVLDHFYISSASVKEVLERVENIVGKDMNKKLNYDKTRFYNALKKFTIPESHTRQTSLFELALMYYSSVPNAQRDNDEIFDIVKAIVSVIEEQINYFENETDREQRLWMVLEEQFKLMVANYDANENVNCGLKIYNHPTVDAIFRCLKNVMGENYNEDIIDEMRQAVKKK